MLMKNTILTIALASLMVSSSQAQEKKPVNDQPLDASFLRLYAETRGFMLGRPSKPKFTPDGKYVLFLRSDPKKAKMSLYEFHVSMAKTREVITPEALLKGAEENLSPEEKARRERQRVSVGGFTDYQISSDGINILTSLSGKLYVIDRGLGRITELNIGKGTLLDPKFSPDGKKVSYVLDYDLFVYDLATSKESQITKGGTEKKTHALAEFVAQEEMYRYTGYWWSPDSKFIAYEEADHEGVEQWFVADSAKPDQPPLPQYYPRPGKKNVAVRLGIIPVTGGETVWVDWDRKKFEYLASVRWDKQGPLTIQVVNRVQQHLLLQLVDPKTGKTTTLLEEQDPAFVNVSPASQTLPKWSEGAKSFLWISESSGNPMLEVRNLDGTKPRLVSPQRDVSVYSLVGSDLKFHSITYLGNYNNDPTRLNLRQHEGRGPSADNPFSNEIGVQSAVSSDDYYYHVLTTSTLKRMPRSAVFTIPTHSSGELPSVAIEPPVVPSVIIDRRTAIEGLFTAIVRPTDFDPKKKYPVILDVYGGPHHLHVTQEMRPWLLKQWLADQGFIVVAIDNRGTPGRGRDWERAIYQKFDSVPIDDQVRGLQLLGKKYPELDLERIGVTGWSFGGYMSALAVLKRPDIFKAGVAGAPVTDWEDYDTFYTERYLGLLPESKKAYDDANLVKMADKLTRPLMLVHGTADDNVYFRHTLKLTDALFRAGKDVDVLPLPSLTHMASDPVVTERMWTKVAGYFQKQLGKAK